MFRAKSTWLAEPVIICKMKKDDETTLVFGKANLISSHKMQPVYMLRGICKNYQVHHSAAKNRANEKLKISTEN